MKIKIGVIISIALCAMFLFCTEPQMAGGTVSEINARVVSQNDASPIPDVDVTLLDDASIDPPRYDKTDSLGYFKFREIKSGVYQLMLKKLTYHDTIILLTINNDTTLAPINLKEIPIPTRLDSAYNSYTGNLQLTWDSVAQNGQKYELHRIDRQTGTEIIKHIIGNAFFTDILFPDMPSDTENIKTITYKIKVTFLDGGISGQWGDSVTISAPRPMVSPPPIYTLANIWGSRAVIISPDLPYPVSQLWYVDSIFIYRSISKVDTVPVRIASLSLKSLSPFIDTVRVFPPSITDSFIQVTYKLQAHSIYGYRSDFSRDTTIKLIQQWIRKPNKPKFNMDDTGIVIITTNSAQFSIDTTTSSVTNDKLLYRIVIFKEGIGLVDSTEWFNIQTSNVFIDVPFIKTGNYLIREQARSTRYDGLYSPFSDSTIVSKR